MGKKPYQVAAEVSRHTAPKTVFITRTAARVLEHLMARENPTGAEKLAQVYFVAGSSVLVAVDDLGSDGQQGSHTSVTLDAEKATALFQAKNKLFHGRIRPVTTHDHPFEKSYGHLSPGDLKTLKTLLRDEEQAVVDPDRQWTPVVLYAGVGASRRRRCYVVFRDGTSEEVPEKIVDDHGLEVAAAMKTAPVLLEGPLPFNKALQHLERELPSNLELNLLRSKKTASYLLRLSERHSGKVVCSIPISDIPSVKLTSSSISLVEFINWKAFICRLAAELSQGTRERRDYYA